MKTQQKAFISLFLCGIIVFWGSQAIGEDLTAEQKEVWAAVQANWETFKAGDVEAALALKHDDMIAWFSSNPDPFKKESLRMAYNYWINSAKPAFVKLEPLNIHIFNNVANVFYLYKWESANKEISDRGRQLEIWVKQDNKWLMTGSLGSSCDTLPPCPYGW
jgi:ketosteroid isomerase-like protein